MKTKEKIIRLLNAAEGRHPQTGAGFFLGADRLHAVREYAGVAPACRYDGTAQRQQRCRIAERFRVLAQRAGITPRQCKDVLRIVFPADAARGLERQVCYGLYGM